MPIISDIVSAIRQHQRFLITSHIRLDGDAVGSEVALRQSLRAMGKDAQIVNDGDVPRTLRFLDPQVEIATTAAAAWPDADATFVLDTATLDRTGAVAKRVRRDAPIINIDHHVSNELFGTLNWIDAECSATGEMLFRLMTEGQMPMPLRAAEALYVAIITDTGRFTQGNTTANALAAAADLVKLGVNAGDMGTRLYRTEPVGLTRLRALAIDTIELHENGQLATVCLTKQMFADTGTQPIDTQEFADMPRSIDGVEVGVLLREIDDGQIKVSFRSQGKVDVNALASALGGGGHLRASGCTVTGKLDEVKAKVVDMTAKALKNHERITL